MFDIPDTKTFMDSVHGYIAVPKCFVSNIIDTEVFQRLRNIDQTGMRILYHNAKHDRFSHSLGVFHLGCKAVDALLENFVQDDYWNISSDSNSVLYWAKNKVLFLIACLLHDIGHAPFSHALEEIVLRNSTDGALLTQRLIERINEIENDSFEHITEIKAAPHEKIGSLFILEHFSNNIEKVFDELIAMQYPTISSSDILYAEHYNYNPIINKNYLSQDICFVARMILGLKYKGYEPEKQIRNCFISLLNGNNFDVDKLDYIIRDTKMSGISNISIDVERLLGAVSIITTTKYLNSIDLQINNDVISNLKGNKNSNIHLKGEFRGTFLFDKKCEVKINQGSTFVSLSSTNHGKIKYADNADIAQFSTETAITQNGEIRKKTNGPQHLKSLPDNNGEPFECLIKDAKLVSESGFNFVVENDVSLDSAVELQINGICDIQIDGNFKIKSPISSFGQTLLEGNIQTAVLIGNFIKEEVPCEQVYNEFVVGFSKQAINIIANVLEARDYLYLWVYAHHKVIYYANFLIPTLSKEILANTQNEQFPSWNLNYQNIIFIDDSYVWTVIKFFHHSKPFDNVEITKLSDELLNRKFKISLYKSLAEYDLLFEAFSDKEKLLAKQFFIDRCRQDLPFVGAEQITAGYLNNDILQQINQCRDLENITNIIYVDASYSTKKIDVNNTFIRFNNDTVAAISEIPLLSNQVSKVGNTNHYFYLYFETTTSEREKIRDESEKLKSVLIEFLKNEITKLP